MIPHREEHFDLCAGYALGSLSESDRLELERHLQGGCSACEAALADFSAATTLLATSAGTQPPPTALRARVLETVGQEMAKAAPAPGPSTATAGRIVRLPAHRLGWATWSLAAAAAALVVVSAVSWNEVQRLSASLEAERRQLAELEQKLALERHWASVLNAPEARVAELRLTPAGVQALKARATYDPRTRSAVIVFENFAAPAGKDYQLWALRGAGVASLGLIKADERGYAVLRLENVGDADTLGGFAVSLEAAGGSPNPAAPTGPVVMAGKFGG